MKVRPPNQFASALLFALLAACLACGSPESSEAPTAEAPAAPADESPAPAAPARPSIDLGSKRETALVETFYPAPLAARADADTTPEPTQSQ